MDSYQTHLTTLPLPALLAEPTALQTQAHHLTSSLTSLTHTSYPTFLSLHQTTTALSNSLGSLSDSLNDLITTSLPALQDATAAWHTRTTDVLHERSKARLVLDQHDKIKDLLDIPIFIDSCVRNGYFQEALALASHVNTMVARPAAPPILASIHVEVEAAIAQMLVVLLGTLNEPGRKLPALWKAVNFLRKMDAFGPAAATIYDTPSRGSIPTDSTHTLSDRDKEDIARYLKKYIDVWREGAYDILTQYSTIFLEQQHQQQPHPTSPQPHPKSPTSHRRPSIQHPPQPTQSQTPPAPSLLPLLSPHLLSHLLPLLKTTLPLLPLSLLPSLLTQLTYCATAFTRVGLDFRGLVGGMISTAVAGAVQRGFHDTSPILGRGKTRVPPARKPSEWLVAPSHLDAPPPPPQGGQAPAHIPPQVLTAYPPLAKHTNALLGVLNALRLLAPIGIMRELVRALDGALGRGGEELMGYLRGFVLEREREGEGDRESGVEDRVARAAGEAYFKVLVPFVRRALVEGVYGVEISEMGEVGGEGEELLRRVVGEWEDVCAA
ncbi:Dor1-like family-domain-containing protein [Lyophyllum atratum]|nr:Dor1-like family-domain-containing protein [Lyophyllum atratum]